MKGGTWKMLILVVCLVEMFQIVRGEGGGYSSGYNYPKPRYQLTYPTFRPYVLKVEQPEEVILTTQQPKEVTCPEPEKIPFIPPEHLEQDKRLRETIQEQENKLNDQERLVKDQEGEIGDQTDKLRQQQREIDEQRTTLERREEELDERERTIGKQQEQITILEEEIRRLRGQPNLGVVLGDKIIEFVEEEKKKAQLEAEVEGDGGLEIIRRRTEQRTTSVSEDEESGSGGVGGVGGSGGTIRESSRSSSSRFSSSGSSGGSLTGDISLDTDTDLDLNSAIGGTGGTGGSRSSSSFSSSSRSSSSRSGSSGSRGGSSEGDAESSNKISIFQRGRDREAQASRNRISTAYGLPFASSSNQRSITIPRPSTSSQSRKRERKETGSDKYRTVEEVTQSCGSNISCWRKLRLQLESGRA